MAGSNSTISGSLGPRGSTLGRTAFLSGNFLVEYRSVPGVRSRPMKAALLLSVALFGGAGCNAILGHEERMLYRPSKNDDKRPPMPVDAGHDAGLVTMEDAGPDAGARGALGMDSGTDAGKDAGTDAGLAPCVEGLEPDEKDACPALEDLVVDFGEFKVPFSPGDEQYEILVGGLQQTLLVTPTTASSYRLKVSGEAVASGESFSWPLTVGENELTIVVSSPSGERTYTLTADLGKPTEHFIKAPNAGADDRFGSSVALSADGLTLAVGAPREDSALRATPNDDSAIDSGAVYVFVNTGTRWEYLGPPIKASDVGAGDQFGVSVALSADGKVLAVGAPQDDSAVGGINVVPDNGRSNSGAVYIFDRVGNAWNQRASIKAELPGQGDFFGGSVAFNADGSVLAVGAYLEDSTPLALDNDDLSNAGAVYLFEYLGSSWTPGPVIKADNASEDARFGSSVALDDAGKTLAVGARNEGSSSKGVDSELVLDPVAIQAGAAYVFRKQGTEWTQDAYLKASNASANSNFGHELSLSGDGNILAVGALAEDSAGAGVNPQASADEVLTDSGAAYVFVRGDKWEQQALIKASNAGASDRFGRAVRISQDGSTLVVGAHQEDSSSKGFNTMPIDAAANDNYGAVYVFGHAGDVWVQQSYVKASNGDPKDLLGYAVGVSGDGLRVVAGAYQESSNGLGVNPLNPVDDGNANISGAAYIFE